MCRLATRELIHRCKGISQAVKNPATTDEFTADFSFQGFFWQFWEGALQIGKISVMTRPAILYRSFANGDLHLCQASNKLPPHLKTND